MADAAAPTPVEAELDRLVEQFGPRLSSPLSRRELATEGGVVLAFLAACTVLLVTVDSEQSWSWGVVIALVVSYALASRVQFQAGAGYTTPTQLLFVPMLFLAPLAAVPLLVAAANTLGHLPDYVAGRRFTHKVVLDLSDAWYAVGPVIVLAAAGAQVPDWDDWPIYVAALAAQFAVDFVAAAVRERGSLGTSPAELLRVLPWVWAVDTLLAPAGLLAAFASESFDYAFLLIVPLPVALGVFAHERRRRLAQAIELRGARADIERRERVRAEALEINDNVVQHLVVAGYKLRRGEADEAAEFVERALGEGKRIIGDLIDEAEPEQRRRTTPAA